MIILFYKLNICICNYCFSKGKERGERGGGAPHPGSIRLGAHQQRLACTGASQVVVKHPAIFTTSAHHQRETTLLWCMGCFDLLEFQIIPFQ